MRTFYWNEAADDISAAYDSRVRVALVRVADAVRFGKRPEDARNREARALKHDLEIYAKCIKAVTGSNFARADFQHRHEVAIARFITTGVYYTND